MDNRVILRHDRTYTFDAAHFIARENSQAKGIHGHTFTVTVGVFYEAGPDTSQRQHHIDRLVAGEIEKFSGAMFIHKDLTQGAISLLMQFYERHNLVKSKLILSNYTPTTSNILGLLVGRLKAVFSTDTFILAVATLSNGSHSVTWDGAAQPGEKEKSFEIPATQPANLQAGTKFNVGGRGEGTLFIHSQPWPPDKQRYIAHIVMEDGHPFIDEEVVVENATEITMDEALKLFGGSMSNVTIL